MGVPVFGKVEVQSPSSRKAGIEIRLTRTSDKTISSPSSRKAGIEIFQKKSIDKYKKVAFLTEGGD